MANLLWLCLTKVLMPLFSFFPTMASRCVILAVLIAAIFHVNISLGAQWLEAFYNDSLPDGAVLGGVMEKVAVEGSPQYNSYVCRFYCYGSIIPCKVETSPLLGSAWATWGTGLESYVSCAQTTYQVLVAGPKTVVSWVPAANGKVPPGAKPTGVLSSGDPLYTCRVMDTSIFGLVPGTLVPPLPYCYICYTGAGNYTTYEVLVIEEPRR